MSRKVIDYIVKAIDDYHYVVDRYYIASVGLNKDYLIQLKKIDKQGFAPYRGDFLASDAYGNYGNVVSNNGAFTCIDRPATEKEIDLFKNAITNTEQLNNRWGV